MTEPMITIIPVLISVVIAANIYATLVLLRSPMYSGIQKLAQSVIVWLLPVVGAILVLALAREVLPRGGRFGQAGIGGYGGDGGFFGGSDHSSFGEGGDVGGEGSGDGGGH